MWESTYVVHIAMCMYIQVAMLLVASMYVSPYILTGTSVLAENPYTTLSFTKEVVT